MFTDPGAQNSRDGLDSIVAMQKDIVKYLPGLVSDFEQRWNAANAELSTLDSSSFSALIAACNNSDAFKHIKKMGPKIVPLVVEKLARETTTTTNNWAVLLYAAIETDEQCCPSAAEQQADLLQCRTRIVELNDQRNELLTDLLTEIEEIIKQNTTSSCMSYLLGEEAYYQVCELGQSAMTPTMVAYIRVDRGPWFYLLHHLAHEQELKVYIFQLPVFQERWEEFFNQGEDGDAPFYTLSGAERHIYCGDKDAEVLLDENRIPIVDTRAQLGPRQ